MSETTTDHVEKDAQDEKDAADATLAGRTAELARERAGAKGTGDEDGSVDEAPTERRPPVSEEAPRPQGSADDAPAGRDVLAAAGSYLRGRATLLAGLARRHRRAAVACALLAICAVVLLGMALSRAGALPGEDVVAADARASFSAPERQAGAFDAGGGLVTQEVEVRSLARSQSAPEGMDAQFGASGYAVAEVVIAYSGQGVRAERGATLGYALVDGAWVALPGARDNGVSWRATDAVDQGKVVAASAELLERAEAESGQAGLAELYAGVEPTVASAEFDEEAQTSVVELAWELPGEFETYACTARATFSFAQASGQWELSGIEVADGATVPNLESIVGTWTGTFQSQETDGDKCLAARSAGLSVTIERAWTSEGVTRASGTVTGLAHYHAHPAGDAESCEGDQAFEAVPFTATRVEGTGVVLETALPEDVGGTVSLTLRFGDEQDPGRATATVETSYPSTGTILFIPYEETLTYADSFLLARADAA